MVATAGDFMHREECSLPGLQPQQGDFGVGELRGICQHLVSEHRSTSAPELLPRMPGPAHSAPRRGVEMTQQVTWNKVSNRKRTLIHQRGFGCQENSLEGFPFFSCSFPGAGGDPQCLLFGQLSVTQRLRRPGRRGAEDRDVG